MKPPTKAENRVLDGLFSFLQEKGYTPSQMELAKRVGLRSANTIDYHLNKLEKKGFLKCPKNRFRAIEIIPEYSPFPNAVIGPVPPSMPAVMTNFSTQKNKEIIMSNKPSTYEKSLRDQIILVLRRNKVPLDLGRKILSQCLSQIQCTQLVEHILKECGMRISGFLTNEHLELYYDIKQGRHDVGYISKGWDDPGFRVGDIVEIKNEEINTFKKITFELLRFCATNGIAFDFKKEKDCIQLRMDGVIYSEGFNKQVFKNTLDTLNECVEKVYELLGREGHC